MVYVHINNTIRLIVPSVVTWPCKQKAAFVHLVPALKITISKKLVLKLH